MSRRKPKQLEDRMTTISAIGIAFGLILMGLVLMWWSLMVENPTLGAFLAQIGGLLVATGALAVAWDLFGRRAFAEEILTKVKLSSDVVESGITRITDQYLENVEWDGLFQEAHRIDIVVAYGATWRNYHRARIVRVASNPNSRIRIFLPDPDDEATVANLAKRFAKNPEEVVMLIRNAIADFQSFQQEGGGKVSVHVRAGDALFSAYRFDSRAVLTLYSHGRERRTSVPTWVMAGGELFSYVSFEIEAIAAQSRVCREA